ncbi:hypothetical protein AVEN_254718-1 [Araneus ventricosus]|uniref:Retroviral polymerase SH3-like domain-containing protein n=1 Tax=Araneus ventricosus TaxID=182803 RepID=A0A4Y2S140_ARAVE|nr:hypothetical protein AVEN_254718-1 [Araneus ventricosus]
MRVPDNLRKLDPKSKKIIFIGYPVMGYHLLDLVTSHVVVSRNAQFNEEKKKCISIQDGFSIEVKDLFKEVVIPDLRMMQNLKVLKKVMKKILDKKEM